MSTLTVANVETANGSTDLTLMTGNSSGPKLVITAGGNMLLNNINVNTIHLSGVTNPYTTNNLTVTKQLNLTGNVTPANLSADNTVDWDPGVAGDYQIRFQANSTNATILEYDVYGLTGGVAGQIITLTNIGPTKVVLRTEEAGNSTFNQANSVNRFSLPNHIPLEGYQSVELYYDGTSQRWRGVDTQGFPFDYKAQLTKGFFAGGYTTLPGSTATTEKITYSTETRSAASNLSQSRVYPKGIGNVDKGFIVGGVASPVVVTTADKITYATEANSAVSSANLSQARKAMGSAGNADKGFSSGGDTDVGSGVVSGLATADRTTYSTETTAAVSGANLSQSRGYLNAVGNSDKGFFTAGQAPGSTPASPSFLATADRTTYSTETTAAVSGANLNSSRYNFGAAGNSDKGFFAGGFGPTFSSVVNKTTYSSETTVIVSSASLSQARFDLAGAGNSDKGFFAGGLTPGAIQSAVADRITYSSETNAAVTGANLSPAKGGLAAV